MSICKRCYVSGRVQGVFFRAATRARARSLEVTGHATNLDDGRVEVLACGDASQVDELIAWLWEGPPAARVDAVDVQTVEESPPADFTTR